MQEKKCLASMQEKNYLFLLTNIMLKKINSKIRVDSVTTVGVSVRVRLSSDDAESGSGDAG